MDWHAHNCCVDDLAQHCQPADISKIAAGQRSSSIARHQ